MPHDHRNTIVLTGEVTKMTALQRNGSDTFLLLKCDTFPHPEVHHLVAWNAQAERLTQTVHIGDSVAITGIVRTSSYMRDCHTSPALIEVTGSDKLARSISDPPLNYDVNVRMSGTVRSVRAAPRRDAWDLRMTLETRTDGHSDLHDVTTVFRGENTASPRVGDTLSVAGRLHGYCDTSGRKLRRSSFVHAHSVAVLERAPERTPDRPPILSRLFKRDVGRGL